MDFTGKLIYNDDGDYEIHGKNKIFYLTGALNEVYYYTDNNHLSLRITCGDKLLFYEDSTIYKKVNEHKLYSYFICGADLEDALFNNTDKTVDVTIIAEALKDYAPFIEEKMC